MNRILRRKRGNRSVLALEPQVRRGAGILAQHAEIILVRQDSELWSRASTPAFLGELWDGVITLRQIAEEAGNLVVLKDENAHHAFTTCRLLCLRLAELPPTCRFHLGQLLLLLADCFCMEIKVGRIPPWEKLPKSLRDSAALAKLYPKVCSVGHLPDHEFPLTLTDCLRFLEALGTVRVPMPLSVLRLDLGRATEGLRTALDQIAAAQNGK